MGDTQETAQRTFGQFYARAVGTRELPGFRLARVVPLLRKREVPRHQHDDAHFVMVLRGNYETGALPAAESGGPLLIYSPPGTTHRDCFQEDDLSRTALATLSVSPTALAEVESDPDVGLPREEVCLGTSASRLLTQLLVDSSVPGSGRGDDLADSIAETLCLELLARTGAERNPAVSGAPAWLRRAREFLRETCLFPGPRNVREIATELGVHPVHLARRFRQQFGTTPGEYLRRCRLEHARKLLRKSSAGLTDIAAATGFSDQSHFSNAFRSGFGVSPGAFRRS